MKFRNNGTIFEEARHKSIQDAAIASGLAASSLPSLWAAAHAQYLTKKGRALLIRRLRDNGYTGVDESDPDWVVPVRNDFGAHVRTHFTGNRLLNRLVFAINARFGSKGFLVDPDGHVAVLLRHPSLSSPQMHNDMLNVIADSRLKLDKPPVTFSEPEGIPIWNCTLVDAQQQVTTWPGKDLKQVTEIKYAVHLHAVLDTAGPALYIEWEKL